MTHIDFLADVYVGLVHEDATPCNSDRGWFGTTKASGGKGCKRRKGRSATARKARQKRNAKAKSLSQQLKGSDKRASAAESALKRRKKKMKKLPGRNTISNTAPLRNRQAAENDD